MKNKKFILLLFITSILFGCFLQREHFDVVRKTPKLKYETPPGCVWLHDNIFIDQAEIRNLDYLEFLYWLNKNDSAKYKAMLPDTLVWRNKEVYNEPYVLYYLRHPGYRNYPVVGISYGQAVAFCEWRSKMVNRFIYIRDHKMPKGLIWDTVNHFPEIVRYRLPTKEEWEFASEAGLEYRIFPMGYEKVLDKNNIPVSNTLEYYNLQRNSPAKATYIRNLECFGPTAFPAWEMQGYTTPILFGQPNIFGVYNLLGNVSEIISDSLFKGLNYETSLDGGILRFKKENYPIVDSTTNGYDYKYTFRYTKPQPFLGFRCVAEVLKEK